MAAPIVDGSDERELSLWELVKPEDRALLPRAPPRAAPTGPIALEAPQHGHEEGVMAIAVQLDFSGGTLEQYDEVIKKMGFTPGGPGEPGGLFHWVTKTDGGMRVTDVWVSKELFEKFAQEKIGPITQAAGVPNPPEVQLFEVHNYLTSGG